MKAFVALLAALNAAGLAPQQVAIPRTKGCDVAGRAGAETGGRSKRRGIVALHGCGGPIPDRDAQRAKRFVADGHPVLFPDSFGSRGLGRNAR